MCAMENEAYTYQRKNTVCVDLSGLPRKPNVHDLHELVYNAFEIFEDEIQSLEVCNYKKKLYMKATSLQIAERIVRNCNGEIPFTYEEIRYILPVYIESPIELVITAFTIPLEVPDAFLVKNLAQFGEITKIVKLTHKANLRFKVYSGRRLLYFKSVKKNIPSYVKLASYNIQLLSNGGNSGKVSEQTSDPTTSGNESETPLVVNKYDFPTLSEASCMLKDKKTENEKIVEEIDVFVPPPPHNSRSGNIPE